MMSKKACENPQRDWDFTKDNKIRNSIKNDKKRSSIIVMANEYVKLKNRTNLLTVDEKKLH